MPFTVCKNVKKKHIRLNFVGKESIRQVFCGRVKSLVSCFVCTYKNLFAYFGSKDSCIYVCDYDFDILSIHVCFCFGSKSKTRFMMHHWLSAQSDVIYPFKKIVIIGNYYVQKTAVCFVSKFIRYKSVDI